MSSRSLVLALVVQLVLAYLTARFEVVIPKPGQDAQVLTGGTE